MSSAILCQSARLNVYQSNCQTRMTVECATPVVHLDFVHTHNTQLNVPLLWYIFTSYTQAHAQQTHTHIQTHKYNAHAYTNTYTTH